MQKREPQKAGVRYHTSVLFFLLLCASRPVRMFFSPEGQVGRREVYSINTCYSLAILFVWAAFTHSNGLWWVFGLAGLSQLLHMLRASRVPHSYTMGPSHLERFCKDPWRARMWESLLTALVGVALVDEDRGAAWWLWVAAFGNAVVVTFVHARNRAIDDDLRDSAIEAAARSDRMGQPPVGRR